MDGNNIERMAYEKSGWSLIEEIDGLPTIIYKGKATSPDANTSEPCWVICRITITETPEGRLTEIHTAAGYNKWDDRKTLEYKY